MKRENEIYHIALSLIKNLGPINAKKLIIKCGSARAVFDKHSLKGKGVILPSDIKQQLEEKSVFEQAEREMRFVEKQGIEVISFFDRNYPFRLKQCEDSPIILYKKGKAGLNPSRSLSVVGTRLYTDYGRSLCENAIRDISVTGCTIVSGLASGIDTIAHEAALKNNLKTIAVLGHGFDRIYPKENKWLAEQITEDGALITEFASCSAFIPGNFAARNRIVAGISDASLVVESEIKGGSMITADLANGYSRDVFTFPFRIGDRNSGGCHSLIKENKAALIESGKDLMHAMNWTPERAPTQLELFQDLNEKEARIAEIIGRQKKIKVDDLAEQSGMRINELLTSLLHLELKKVVRSLPGAMYELSP